MLNVQPIKSRFVPNLKKSVKTLAQNPKAKKIALPKEIMYAEVSKNRAVVDNIKNAKGDTKINYDYCGSIELMCVPLLSF